MWVALLRGINVGGNRKLPMADLKVILTGAGCSDVVTYIQSGNVVFSHQAPDAQALEAAIEKATGMAVPVILRSSADLARVIEDNPFDEPDPTRLHVGFLAGQPKEGAEAAFAAVVAPFPDNQERFALIGDHLYLHLPEGLGRAKLPQALGVWKTPITVRNWRTVIKLAELAAQ
jgi:uncharacterized protein (DUF1697 family)